MRPMSQRVHLTYTEPFGRTNPPLHATSAAEAEQYIAAMRSLIGADAAKRRTWSITPSDCEVCR